MCLWAIYLFPGSVHIFSPAEKADPSWEYIIRSQTHECGNWDWDPDIPFLGIFVSNFRLCNVWAWKGKVNNETEKWKYKGEKGKFEEKWKQEWETVKVERKKGMCKKVKILKRAVKKIKVNIWKETWISEKGVNEFGRELFCSLQRQNAENLKQIFPEKEKSQFPHSCVCERIIYSHDGSACSAGGNM
jgi:hypothetical protein